MFENNLYVKDLAKNKITAITKDGEKNKVINGMCDWVYEEEFRFTKAYEWSGDGNKLAFIRFDESMVPEFVMPMYEDDAYPRYEKFKYPKVGESNSKVKVMMYDVTKEKLQEINTGEMMDFYIPRIKWTNDANLLCVQKLNRHQNHLQFILVDAKNKKTSILLEEKSKYYIDITDNLTFLKDGKHFVITSEKNGFNSIYLYNMKGQQIKQLTESKYDVLSMYGIDEKRSIVYFQAIDSLPKHNAVFSVKLDGKDFKRLSPDKGSNIAEFAPLFEYYTLRHSQINTASRISVHKTNGETIRVLQDNAHVKQLQKDYGAQEISFFNFTTSEQVVLNGWQLKPANFDPKMKYPVLITQYSGPNSLEATDGWKGSNYWWFQLLAQKGIMVVCVDPRGTGGRGEEFRKMTYMQLGKYETLDLIETAKYLGNLPYIDKGRIGIFGWSYGGYMSSLAILKGNDFFKTAIAVAPVTNWKWYDSVYTERYMKTYKENESGYKDNSPVYFADRLKGNFLLVHGTADDNVHFQNSAEMAKALIKANKQFDSCYYPNKNHGIYGDNARIHLYTKMTNFLLEKL